jgi:hypothetical protein
MTRPKSNTSYLPEILALLTLLAVCALRTFV